MHDAILFISDEPADIDISTAFISPEDIGMGGIADYIGEKLSIPETIAGVKVNSDGSFVLTRQDIEAFFTRRFDELKRMVSELSLTHFCSDDLYNIKYTIEQRYETYTVLITEPDNDNYFADTLDSFLRKSYAHCGENESKTFYIVSAVDYHW